MTFDAGLAHPGGNNYHNHAQPLALRHQLGDHVDYNAATNTYTESTAPVTKHSPIVGWAADGLPMYEPYGYSDPNNANTGVRRMVPGFVLRNGANGTTNITERQGLPLWAQRIQNRTTLAANQSGPVVNAAYLLGHYIEDYDYLGDLDFTLGTTVDVIITLTAPPNIPAAATPTSVTLAGTTVGTSYSRPSTTQVKATFVIPVGAATGAQSIVVTFPGPTFTLTGALTIQ